MGLQTETTAGFDPLIAGLETVIHQQETTEDDVFRLRQALYQPSPLSHEHAEHLLATHRKMPAKDERWIQFFVDSLADVFLAREQDHFVLRDAMEDRLLTSIGASAPIMDLGHRRLALRLFLRATKVSKHYQQLVFDTVHHHLLHDDRRLLIDLQRQAGSIDIIDLQLVRKLIYGAGGQYPVKIGQTAADFLLKLDLPSFSIASPDMWQDLISKAMCLYLTMDCLRPGESRRQIDDDSVSWFAEQLTAGRSGSSTATVIAHLAREVDDLPPQLETWLDEHHSAMPPDATKNRP